MTFVFEKNVKGFEPEVIELQALLRRTHHDWRYGVVKDIEHEVPVGSIRFVESVLGHKMRPIEVPACLRKPEFLGREYSIVPYSKLPETGRWFVKDASELKAFFPHVMEGDVIKDNLKSLHTSFDFENCMDMVDESYLQHRYVISEPIKFRSEWRVLVCNQDVVGCICYAGDNLAFPAAEMIRAMVGSVLGQPGLPAAYTLDVGVSANGRSHLIEMHNFVSCGTYGCMEDALVWMYQKGFWYELGGGYIEENSE